MSQNTQKTIHHTNLELKRILNIQFQVDDFSTLNQHFGVQVSATANPLPVDTYPQIKYLALGRGGHKYAQGAQPQAALIDILRHGPTDARLFEHIPFVVRDVANDLSAGEQANYRMRTVVNIAGTDYAHYWLKVIDTNAITPETRVIQILDGVIIDDQPYSPSNASLNPAPIDVDNNDLNLADGRYITVRSSLGLTLAETDILEILDAIDIIYGDARYATISEVGIVSGHENGSGEITHAQILNFIGTEIPLQHQPESVDLDYSLANTMPYPLPTP